MIRVWTLIFILSLASLPVFAKSVTPPAPDWKFVEKRLLKAGLEREFIKGLKENYDPQPFSEVLELNTLLFLRKSDYHGVQVNDDAADAVRTFISGNKEAFDSAEKKYHVSRGVIASLLWMESRHGKNQGQFHVPSVFVDLVQADRPAVVLYLHQAAKRFTDHLTRKNRRDITSRTKKRVIWAIAELKAIQTMQRKNKDVLHDFKGSFAGAFGMAQFEPSSYVHYARAESADHPANLEQAGDAIHSVAFYLHKSGWKPGRSKSFVRALMRYNNSHDYAAAILKLASQASPGDEPNRRRPASKKKPRLKS